MAKKPKVAKKGKSEKKNKPTSKKYSKYKIDGDNIVREAVCPRCGPGVFLMKAKDRVYCGKCHYSEFVSKNNVNKESLRKETSEELSIKEDKKE